MIIKRIIKLVLYFLWIILFLSIITPLIYYVLTGCYFIDLKYEIDYLWE